MTILSSEHSRLVEVVVSVDGLRLIPPSRSLSWLHSLILIHSCSSKFEFSKEILVALRLSLVYIPIPRIPDVPKSALFGSKLTLSIIYSGMDILAKSI